MTTPAPALEGISAAPVEQGAIAAQLAADAQRPAGSTKVPDGSLSSVNVERKLTDEGSLTRFPNGVSVDTASDCVAVTAPPGGTIGSDAKGCMVVYDSHHKAVAEMDKDKTVHVHTKNGEYTETRDGKVTFTPSGPVSDLRTLHKPGNIPQSKYEDYGLATDGKVTQFPNNIEYNPKTGQVIVPADYPNFNEQKHTDANGNVTSRSGYDGNGKLLYTVDGTGIHVPTSDGTLSQGSGAVNFKPNETAGTKSLPKVDIVDPLDPNGPCAKSMDPLCGLDLGKF
jgi:hypothetical protein